MCILNVAALGDLPINTRKGKKSPSPQYSITFYAKTGVVIEFLSHGEFAEIIFGYRSVAGEHESLLITSD